MLKYYNVTAKWVNILRKLLCVGVLNMRIMHEIPASKMYMKYLVIFMFPSILIIVHPV